MNSAPLTIEKTSIKDEEYEWPAIKALTCATFDPIFRIWTTTPQNETKYSDLFGGMDSGCSLCTLLLDAIQHFKCAETTSRFLYRVSIFRTAHFSMVISYEAYAERNNIEIYEPLGKVAVQIHMPPFGSPDCF